MIEAHPVFVVGEVLPGAGFGHGAYHEQTVGSSHEAVETDHGAIGKGQIDSSSHSVSRWAPRGRRLSFAGAAPSVQGPPVLPGAVQVNTLTRGIGRPFLLIEHPVLTYRADGNFHRGLLSSSPRLGALGPAAARPPLISKTSSSPRLGALVPAAARPPLISKTFGADSAADYPHLGHRPSRVKRGPLPPRLPGQGRGGS